MTLQTEENGTYEVVIFAVREGSGIFDSDVQFSNVMIVMTVEDSDNHSIFFSTRYFQSNFPLFL